MNRPGRHPLIRGAWVVSLGTLASRVLGMLRDMATASLLGLASGGVMDAFVVAFRVPNLFRRLFGEGAMAASYLPVLTAQLEKGRPGAWQLASVTLTLLAVLLGGLLLLGEAIYGLVWLVWGDAPGMGLLVGLGVVMLPYMLLMCLGAQLTATLHALSHFAVPALTPTLLNVCWLAAAWFVAPCFAPDQAAQAYVLAGAVLVAGVLQVSVQLPVLWRFGFRFDYNWGASRAAIGRIARTMVPMLFGLAVSQINTFVDSLIAWGLAAAAEGPRHIAWLGGAVQYPLRQGAASAVYYGERLYEFPLAVLGLAVATAIFPLLSRHAARGDRRQLGADLTLGLRLVLFLAVPAGVGLMLLAEPLARLLFERGQFTPDDTMRTARMITCYGSGVWAFCAAPVVVRGFYALGDNFTPVRIAIAAVGLNLLLDLSLIWTPLAEAGLAVATSTASMAQVVTLMLLFSRRNSALDWSALGATAARALLATLLMAAAGYIALRLVPPADSLTGKLARVALPLSASLIVYGGAYWLLRGRELGLLIGRGLMPGEPPIEAAADAFDGE